MEHNTITDEQRARAERNRQAALAKKRKRGQPAPPAASGAAEAPEAPKMSREEYASICRMFGTQPSQPSQAPQPSQQDGDGWPTSCVDVTEDEPPRAERPARDNDREAPARHDDGGAAPSRDDREAAPAREDRSAAPAREDDATPAGVDPVRVDRVEDDEEAVDLLVGADDMLTYDEARRAIDDHVIFWYDALQAWVPGAVIQPVTIHIAQRNPTSIL